MQFNFFSVWQYSGTDNPRKRVDFNIVSVFISYSLTTDFANRLFLSLTTTCLLITSQSNVKNERVLARWFVIKIPKKPSHFGVSGSQTYSKSSLLFPLHKTASCLQIWEYCGPTANPLQSSQGRKVPRYQPN